MNPKVVAELASGNPEKFAEYASKATLGTMQLGSPCGSGIQNTGREMV